MKRSVLAAVTLGLGLTAGIALLFDQKRVADMTTTCITSVRDSGALPDVVDLCHRAARRGSGEAAYVVAAIAAEQPGVLPKGLNLALLNQAVAAGIAPALTVRALTTLRLEETDEVARASALAELNTAASLGYAPAQLWLAVALLSERSESAATAADLLWKAARQGSADAQFLLAKLYREGQGVIADRQRMRDLYVEAAQRGHPGAAFNLSVDLFNRGERDRAYAWLSESAAGGFAPALLAMGDIELQRQSPNAFSASVYFHLAGRLSVGDQRGKAERAAAMAEAQLDVAQRRTIAARVDELEAEIRGVWSGDSAPVAAEIIDPIDSGQEGRT